MSAIRATYFDGKSSSRHDVAVEAAKNAFGEPLLHVHGEGINVAWPIGEVRVSSRIGDSPRRLDFPDGAQCETRDNEAVDVLFAAYTPAGERLLRRWEGALRYALAAVAITIAAAVVFTVWGIPALAKHVAFALPAQTQSLIGGDTLSALDRFVLGPSQLPRERQQALRRLCEGMSAELGGGEQLRLELRQGKRAGANAFALPAGIIVMTDELVALARDDREIEAVLAHEIGHQRQRHLLRQFLQDSATALLLAAAIGDVTSITSLAAAAPTLVLRAKFSRDFEREADDFALDYLARHQIPAQKFADILQRLEERRPGGKEAGKGGGTDYLSTHPSTRERILRAQGNR